MGNTIALAQHRRKWKDDKDKDDEENKSSPDEAPSVEPTDNPSNNDDVKPIPASKYDQIINDLGKYIKEDTEDKIEKDKTNLDALAKDMEMSNLTLNFSTVKLIKSEVELAKRILETFGLSLNELNEFAYIRFTDEELKERFVDDLNKCNANYLNLANRKPLTDEEDEELNNAISEIKACIDKYQKDKNSITNEDIECLKSNICCAKELIINSRLTDEEKKEINELDKCFANVLEIFIAICEEEGYEYSGTTDLIVTYFNNIVEYMSLVLTEIKVLSNCTYVDEGLDKQFTEMKSSYEEYMDKYGNENLPEGFYTTDELDAIEEDFNNNYEELQKNVKAYNTCVNNICNIEINVKNDKSDQENDKFDQALTKIINAFDNFNDMNSKEISTDKIEEIFNEMTNQINRLKLAIDNKSEIDKASGALKNLQYEIKTFMTSMDNLNNTCETYDKDILDENIEDKLANLKNDATEINDSINVVMDDDYEKELDEMLEEIDCCDTYLSNYKEERDNYRKIYYKFYCADETNCKNTICEGEEKSCYLECMLRDIECMLKGYEDLTNDIYNSVNDEWKEEKEKWDCYMDNDIELKNEYEKIKDLDMFSCTSEIKGLCFSDYYLKIGSMVSWINCEKNEIENEYSCFVYFFGKLDETSLWHTVYCGYYCYIEETIIPNYVNIASEIHTDFCELECKYNDVKNLKNKNIWPNCSNFENLYAYIYDLYDDYLDCYNKNIYYNKDGEYFEECTIKQQIEYYTDLCSDINDFKKIDEEKKYDDINSYKNTYNKILTDNENINGVKDYLKKTYDTIIDLLEKCEKLQNDYTYYFEPQYKLKNEMNGAEYKADSEYDENEKEIKNIYANIENGYFEKCDLDCGYNFIDGSYLLSNNEVFYYENLKKEEITIDGETQPSKGAELAINASKCKQNAKCAKSDYDSVKKEVNDILCDIQNYDHEYMDMKQNLTYKFNCECDLMNLEDSALGMYNEINTTSVDVVKDKLDEFIIVYGDYLGIRKEEYENEEEKDDIFGFIYNTLAIKVKDKIKVTQKDLSDLHEYSENVKNNNTTINDKSSDLNTYVDLINGCITAFNDCYFKADEYLYEAIDMLIIECNVGEINNDNCEKYEELVEALSDDMVDSIRNIAEKASEWVCKELEKAKKEIYGDESDIDGGKYNTYCREIVKVILEWDVYSSECNKDEDENYFEYYKNFDKEIKNEYCKFKDTWNSTCSIKLKSSYICVDDDGIGIIEPIEPEEDDKIYKIYKIYYNEYLYYSSDTEILSNVIKKAVTANRVYADIYKEPEKYEQYLTREERCNYSNLQALCEKDYKILIEIFETFYNYFNPRNGEINTDIRDIENNVDIICDYTKISENLDSSDIVECLKNISNNVDSAYKSIKALTGKLTDILENNVQDAKFDEVYDDFVCNFDEFETCGSILSDNLVKRVKLIKPYYNAGAILMMLLEHYLIGNKLDYKDATPQYIKDKNYKDIKEYSDSMIDRYFIGTEDEKYKIFNAMCQIPEITPLIWPIGQTDEENNFQRSYQTDYSTDTNEIEKALKNYVNNRLEAYLKNALYYSLRSDYNNVRDIVENYDNEDYDEILDNKIDNEFMNYIEEELSTEEDMDKSFRNKFKNLSIENTKYIILPGICGRAFDKSLISDEYTDGQEVQILPNTYMYFDYYQQKSLMITTIFNRNVRALGAIRNDDGSYPKETNSFVPDSSTMILGSQEIDYEITITYENSLKDYSIGETISLKNNSKTEEIKKNINMSIIFKSQNVDINNVEKVECNGKSVMKFKSIHPEMNCIFTIDEAKSLKCDKMIGISSFVGYIPEEGKKYEISDFINKLSDVIDDYSFRIGKSDVKLSTCNMIKNNKNYMSFPSILFNIPVIKIEGDEKDQGNELIKEIEKEIIGSQAKWQITFPINKLEDLSKPLTYINSQGLVIQKMFEDIS